MIRPTAKEMHFQYHSAEIPVAKALGEGFDVNYGQVYKNNNIEVSYYFLGARASFKARFGLEQEILAIYDWHEKSDARIFSAIADLLNRYKKTRLDPAVVLIIITGEITNIQPMLDKNKEIAFVAIQRPELLSNMKSPYFLRRELTKILGGMDLFSMSSPLETDTYLFGREDLLNTIISKTCQQKENSGIFGLRKTGKTSVLFALQRRYITKDILSVYIDCHKPIYKYRWWRLLEYIASRIATDDITKSKELVEEQYYKGYTEDNCIEKFEILIRSIRSKFSQIVLLFDEIEYITPTIAGLGATHWDDDFIPFWQTLRALHQETHGEICFVVAGVNPFITENAYIEDKQNPIFQLIQPTYIKPLAKSIVRNMVRSIGKYLGMKFAEEVYDYLTEQFGGHAYLIRLACSELYRNSSGLINDEEHIFNVPSFSAIDNQITSRLKSPCMEIVLSLMWWYPDEYELLKIVCEGDLDFVKAYINENERNYFHIANYGLLDDKSYDFKIRTINDYLQNFGNEWEKSVSPFKRSGFTEEQLPVEPNLTSLIKIYEKRAALEKDLRKIVYLYLSMSTGFNSVKTAQKILDGLKSPDAKELFFGREARVVMNELYFTDLHAIMNKHWSIFGELFGTLKQRFDMNMETIAKFRNDDAHVKPVSEEDILNFNNSHAWICHFLNKVKEQIA